jgi:hypothetical protein
MAKVAASTTERILRSSMDSPSRKYTGDNGEVVRNLPFVECALGF